MTHLCQSRLRNTTYRVPLNLELVFAIAASKIGLSSFLENKSFDWRLK